MCQRMTSLQLSALKCLFAFLTSQRFIELLVINPADVHLTSYSEKEAEHDSRDKNDVMKDIAELKTAVQIIIK